jgi:hypothetical protein
LQAEVAAYIEAHVDQLDAEGHRLVVRNGHHEPRKVTTAVGAVPVRAPRVNDKRVDEVSGERRRFSSAILPTAVTADHAQRHAYRMTMACERRGEQWISVLIHGSSPHQT